MPPRPRHSEVVRRAAVIAYLVTAYLAVTAGARACKESFLRLFRRLAPGHMVSEDSARKFGMFWSARWWEVGNLADVVRRRPNMPDGEVRTIATALEAGVERTI